MAEFDPQWLDRMYNNRALVPDHAAYFSRWAESSAAARSAEPCTLDVPYGTGPGETLDIFPAAQASAPVVVFIHGGYWRSLDKSDHSFVAPAFTQAGACVVVPNYALCPAVTVSDITLQMVKCVAWVWRNIHRFGGDPSRITLVGHSAGGTLVTAVAGYLADDDALDDLVGIVMLDGVEPKGSHAVNDALAKLTGKHYRPIQLISSQRYMWNRDGDMADKLTMRFSIVSEMLDARNRELAEVARAPAGTGEGEGQSAGRSMPTSL